MNAEQERQAPRPEPRTDYDRALARGEELIAKPLGLGGPARILQQHEKGRMTVLERVRVLTAKEPNILWQNWGENLDGASILTAIIDVATAQKATRFFRFCNLYNIPMVMLDAILDKLRGKFCANRP